MHPEMLNLMIECARREVEACHCQIDWYGEAFMRQALSNGRCVQITIPDPSIQTICPVAVTGNQSDSRIWFFRNGQEDMEMQERYVGPVRKWVDDHRGHTVKRNIGKGTREVFWYDGYDYTVDIEMLRQKNGVCYIWDTKNGWMKLILERKENKLTAVDNEIVKKAPSDALIAPHVAP